MRGNVPNSSQERAVLEKLKEAKGSWINKQVFIREMFLTQAGRAIFNLENKPNWIAEYAGMKIEHSPFTDQHGFKSYRLIPIDHADDTISIATEVRRITEDEAVRITRLFNLLPAS